MVAESRQTKLTFVGRPSKFTPQTKSNVLAAIRKGMKYYDACSAAGIGYSTFRRWLLLGEEADTGEFWQFWEDIKKAEAEVVDRRLSVIDAAAVNGQWKAAVWFLERRYPERWGRMTVGLNHRTISDEEIAKMTDEEISQLLNG